MGSSRASEIWSCALTSVLSFLFLRSNDCPHDARRRFHANDLHRVLCLPGQRTYDEIREYFVVVAELFVNLIRNPGHVLVVLAGLPNTQHTVCPYPPNPYSGAAVYFPHPAVDGKAVADELLVAPTLRRIG